MFYVSSISGTQIPFDPRITPIANAAQPISPAPQAAPVPQISATETFAEIAAAADANAVQTTDTSDVSTISEEPVVYEWYAIPAGRSSSGGSDMLNIGRAGAVMAYQIRESESADETHPPEAFAPVGSVQGVKNIDDGAGESLKRVNPVKRSNYRNPPPLHERKRVVAAADIMSAPVFALRDNLPIEAAQKIFAEHKFRHIPVVSPSGKLVGILSDRDFIGVLPQDRPKAVQIKERMVTNILTARPQTEIRAIAEVMILHHIGCLPIIDEHEALVGILTRSDILRAIVNHAPIELWT